MTNVGPRPGIETAQLYLRQTGTSVARPIRELKGYERLPLAPGTSRIVRFRLTGADLLFTGLDMRRTVEPGGLHPLDRPRRPLRHRRGIAHRVTRSVVAATSVVAQEPFIFRAGVSARPRRSRLQRFALGS